MDTLDYEWVDIFTWQEEATGMTFQMKFVRWADVQAETVERIFDEKLE